MNSFAPAPASVSMFDNEDRLFEYRGDMPDGTFVESNPLSEVSLTRPHFADGIVGRSPVMSEVLRQVSIVAPMNSTVLILGETGTGKELIAEAIHSSGTRRNKPFIKVNCAAMPAG